MIEIFDVVRNDEKLVAEISAESRRRDLSSRAVSVPATVAVLVRRKEKYMGRNGEGQLLAVNILFGDLATAFQLIATDSIRLHLILAPPSSSRCGHPRRASPAWRR